MTLQMSLKITGRVILFIAYITMKLLFFAMINLMMFETIKSCKLLLTDFASEVFQC